MRNRVVIIVVLGLLNLGTMKLFGFDVAVLISLAQILGTIISDSKIKK